MKTAIQELLEIINHPMRPVTISAKEIVIWIINTGLEKEKEQIIDACNMGIDLESHLLINDGEEYYNQKFNQNK